MTETRKFTGWEKQVINHFYNSISSSPHKMEEWLCSFYFTEVNQRAAIIQAKGHYTVFFMALAIFEDEQKRNEELDRLLQLITLIRWLKEQGYILLYKSSVVNEKVMYFLQDDFQNAKPSGNSIILNDKGDTTSAPDIIHDKNQNVIYKGIVLNNDYHEVVISSITGNLHITQAIENLQKMINPEPTAIAAPQQEEHPIPQIVQPVMRRKSTLSSLIILCLILVVALCIFTVFLFYRTEQLDVHMNRLSAHQSNLYKELETAKEKKSNPSEIFRSPSISDTGYFYGIDVSHWNGNLITELPATDSLSFAICKATEGSSGVDPDFETNWHLITEKKLIKGAYHFFRAHDNITSQAAHFNKVIRVVDSADMPPIVDVEEMSLHSCTHTDSMMMQENLLKLLSLLESSTKRIPMIYTDAYFSKTYLKMPAFGKYPLWIADYTKSPKPNIPEVWEKSGYRIWQRTDKQNINSHIVDYDVYFGSRINLNIN